MSQPVEVYPNNPLPRQSNNSSHSNGSFGPVFAVLGVIVVVSAVACVLGRLCNRRYHRDAAKEATAHQYMSSKAKRQSHGLGPNEWESRQEPSFNTRDGDIEFGFDKKIPSVKMAKNGGGREKQAHVNGTGHSHKPEVRFADNV